MLGSVYRGGDGGGGAGRGRELGGVFLLFLLGDAIGRRKFRGYGRMGWCVDMQEVAWWCGETPVANGGGAVGPEHAHSAREVQIRPNQAKSPLV